MAVEYDVIVVGLGAMGSAAAYHLASRGQRVLGLDAFEHGHTLGSSHGETRIIRMAYSEHAAYVPLLQRAYALWEQLEKGCGRQLLRRTGGLFIGPHDSQTVAGALRSAQVHSLPHEVLDPGELRRRFAVLRPASDELALFEDDAGVLFPERCIDAHLELARAHGADLRHMQPVTSWSAGPSGVQVHTHAGAFSGSRLVLTAGAWLGKLTAELDLPLQPERNPIFWFEPLAHTDAFDAGRMPIWIWDTGAAGAFYSTPHVEWPGVKVGQHHSRRPCDPDTIDRSVSDEDEQPLRTFLEQRIPDLAGPVALSKVCIYTNTPDEHFLVDRHPRHPNVFYAGGFSGHGFKFASVMGEILADLATRGEATAHAEFLRAARFSDPRTSVGASR